MDKELKELSDIIIEALNYWVFSFCNAYTPQTKEAIERKNNDIKKAKRAKELLKELGSTISQTNDDYVRNMTNLEWVQSMDLETFWQW